MASFGWKKKTGSLVHKRERDEFEQNAQVDDTDVKPNAFVDWTTLIPQKKAKLLINSQTSSEKLKLEGEAFAEASRYWEAIKKWDEALLLTPQDERLHEMKAQAYLCLREMMSALQSAKRAIDANCRWWIAYQTLGRIQMNLGEVKMAIKSFSRAVHLNPAETELWNEDLRWSAKLLHKKDCIQQETESLLSEQSQQLHLKMQRDSDDSNEDNSEDEDVLVARRTVVDVNAETKVNFGAFRRNNINSLSAIPSDYVLMRD